jgi:hypothetical protein
MTAPPLVRIPHCCAVNSGPGFRFITPLVPNTIKRVHTVGHVDSRINKCCSGQSVFLIQLEGGGHMPPGKASLLRSLMIITANCGIFDCSQDSYGSYSEYKLIGNLPR